MTAFDDFIRERDERVAGDLWGYIRANDGMGVGSGSMFGVSGIVMPDPSVGGATTSSFTAQPGVPAPNVTTITDLTLGATYNFSLLVGDALAYAGTWPDDNYEKSAHVIEVWDSTSSVWYRYPVAAVIDTQNCIVHDPTGRLTAVGGPYTYRARYAVDVAKRYGHNHDGINSRATAFWNKPYDSSGNQQDMVEIDSDTLDLLGNGYIGTQFTDVPIDLTTAINGAPTVSYALFTLYWWQPWSAIAEQIWWGFKTVAGSTDLGQTVARVLPVPAVSPQIWPGSPSASNHQVFSVQSYQGKTATVTATAYPAWADGNVLVGEALPVCVQFQLDMQSGGENGTTLYMDIQNSSKLFVYDAGLTNPPRWKLFLNGWRPGR